MPFNDQIENCANSFIIQNLFFILKFRMGQDSIDFIKPEHPLPDEITKLSLDETVCKYCGISYLIHREVAKLQDQVAKLEKGE